MSGSKEYQKHILTLNLGINLSQINGIDQRGFGPIFGGKYSLYFNKNVGVFVGLDYLQRNGKEEGYEEFQMASIQLDFMDIPFGLVLRYKDIISSNRMTFLGLYHTLPRDGKVRGLSEKMKASIPKLGTNHFGFLLQSEAYIKFDKMVDFGVFMGMKFNFGGNAKALGIIETEAGKYEYKYSKTWDVIFGLAVRF